MIHILIAAFNEETDLPRLLERFARERWPFEYSILVVNDGSTDSTRAAAAAFSGRLPVRVIDHAVNLGLGRALATGIRDLSEKMVPGDIIVTMDADNSHPPDIIPSLVKQIELGSDIAIASRFAPGASQSGVPAARRFLSRAAALVLSACLPVAGARDYTSGFRAFSAALVARLSASFGSSMITEGGFAATFELLLKCARTGAVISEVPIRLEYYKKSGASKMKVCSTIKTYLRLIARLWAGR